MGRSGISAAPTNKPTLAKFNSQSSVVRGLLGTGPPDPILESDSPSPPRGSIWHRFNIEIGSNQEIDVESMVHRCQIDGKSTPE